MRTSLAFACAALAWSTPGQATGVMDVVDPRPAAHVVDLTGTLDAAALASIEASVQRAAADGELMVVVVPSTDGAPPRQWTTALFNRLRLDTKERNRGVLLMAAIKDRKAEIVVGEGFDGSVVRITDDIMQNTVVASFKRGDPKGAMVFGAEAIAARVIAAPKPVDVKPVIATVPVEETTPERVAAVMAASASKQMKAIVDPRPKSAILDLAKSLQGRDVVEIDGTARVQIAEGIEPVFVIVKDTGKHEQRAFALAVFEKLNLKAAPRGVLVLGVTGTKSVELVHGDGFPAFTSASLAAMASSLDAQAKASGVNVAMVASARLLSNLGMEIAMTGAQLAAQAKADAEAARVREDGERAARLAAAQAQATEFDREEQNPLVYVAGAGALGIGGLGVREVLRRRPRSCKKCSVRMHRLAEEADDKHLADGERAEERLGSVDYDIWACGSCGDVLKTRWGAIFTSFSRCKGCSWKTMRSSSRTITPASTLSTGLAEVTETCSHCSLHNRYTRVIPRVQKSSSSGSSGGRSGGGGFSSGRGSSGSW